MKNNFSLTQNMQISKETAYVGLSDASGTDCEVEKLSQNYVLRRIDDLERYLKKDERLVQYILSITPIINSYFPQNKKYLTYCIDPEFSDLNQAVICVIGNDSSFEEEHDLMNRLNSEILHLDEFSVEVKSSVAVRMWWL